jgi:hypothetical protein
MTLIDVDEIFYLTDKNEREEKAQYFRDNCKKLLTMIKEESGLKQIEKLYGSLTKAKHQSDFIDLYREARKKYLKEVPKGSISQEPGKAE